DESVPRRLKRDFVGHEVFTVPEMGWSSVKNGELLKLAQGQFDVLIVVDRNLQYQQNLKRFNIGIMLLVAKSNRYVHLKPLIPEALERLTNIPLGGIVVIGSN